MPQQRFTPPTYRTNGLCFDRCTDIPLTGAPTISAETLAILRAQQVRDDTDLHILQPVHTRTTGR